MSLKKTQDAPKYSIIEKMAVGSFGVVFKIKRLSDNTTMVMKRIPLENLDREQRHEAAKELSLISELHHPYIVAQRDAFLFDENDLCLVMDYYDGGDLDYLLARQRDKDQYFEFEQVMLWFVQMLLALDYLHSHGIVHRDVKTHNLFLDQASNTIAVGDFGISEKVEFTSAKKDVGAVGGGTAFMSSPILTTTERSQRWEGGGPHHYDIVGHPHGRLPPPATNSEGVDGPHRASSSDNHRPEPDMTSLSHAADGVIHGPAPDSPSRMIRSPMRIAVKGTPLYMPPEALQGMPYGPKSDVWSLGCILYELLSLRHPFDSTDIGGLIIRIMLGDRESLPSHYPSAVSELINATLTLECAKRPSCDELLHTPLVSAYVRRLLELRNQTHPRDADSKRSDGAKSKNSLARALTGLQKEEKALQCQLRRIYGSLGADSILSKEGSHATMSYLECTKQLKTPLNPPSYDCEQAHRGRRTASMLVQLTSGSSALTTDALDNTTPKAFLTRNTPPSLELGPVMPPFASTRQSPLSHDSGDNVGHQATSADPRVRLSTLAPDGPPKCDSANDSDVPDRARRGPDGTERRFLPDAAVPSPSKSSICDFFVEHSNVKDMRDQPLTALAVEVLRVRALLQRALFERQRRRDAERLLLDVGPHLVATMPQTFRDVPMSASDTAATRTASSFLHHTTEESGQRVAASAFFLGLAPGLGCAGLSKSASLKVRGYSGEMPWEASLPVGIHATADTRLQPYLDRRAALLRLILEELSATTLSRVYAYYREYNIFVRDPGLVLSLVPERKQWKVLPFVEDIVVLDKFIEQNKNNNNDEVGSTRTVSSGQISF